MDESSEEASEPERMDENQSTRETTLNTTTDATLYTASAPHVHTLGLPQGPICLLLGHIPSFLADTNNEGDAHDT